jgi:hypothetical protein
VPREPRTVLDCVRTTRPPHSSARLRSGSGRSRPRPKAPRSPTPAVRRGPTAPRLLPTAHHRADGRTPLDTRPRRRGRAAAGPGLIAPCPTPGPAPDRTGRGRRQPAPHGPARPAPAGSGGHPSARLTTRLLAVPTGPPPRGVAAPPAPGARVVGRLLDLLLLRPWATAWHSREHSTALSPTTRKSCTKMHCCPQKNWVESTAGDNERKAGEADLISTLIGARNKLYCMACFCIDADARAAE